MLVSMILDWKFVMLKLILVSSAIYRILVIFFKKVMEDIIS